MSFHRASGVVLPVLCALLSMGKPAQADNRVDLIVEADAQAWRLSEGREFPGAKGELVVETTAGLAVRLTGDFSGGGHYVAALRSVPSIHPDVLTFRVKSPGADTIVLRLTDAGGVTHQLRLAVEPRDGWQRVQLPVARLFENMGRAGAVKGVRKYESWGGEKGGQRWQPPIKTVAVLLSRLQLPSGEKRGDLWIADMTLLGAPLAEQGSAASQAQAIERRTVDLDEVLQAGYSDWKPFAAGGEIKVSVAENQPEPGRNALRVAASFTGSGQHYAGVSKSLKDLNIKSVEAITMRVKSPNALRYTLRLLDASGQTHQRKDRRLQPGGDWQDLRIDLERFARGEHWGGANDGKLHQPLRGFTLVLKPNPSRDLTAPELYITGVSAHVSVGAQPSVSTYTEGFEDSQHVEVWETIGDVRRVSEGAMEGEATLRLTRTLDDVNRPISARGPEFSAAPGAWSITGATRASIHSPDSSFHGVLLVQWLDGSGHRLGGQTVVEAYDRPTWQAFRKSVTAPPGTVSGRIYATMRKTNGWFEFDALAAAKVETPPVQAKLQGVRVGSDVVGNLFRPGETAWLNVVAYASKPLDEDQRRAAWVVRDYWGAEQLVGGVALESSGFRDGRFTYRGRVDLETSELEVGRFYQARVTVDPDGEAVADHRGLAVLPEAEANAYAPADIPFSIRNWDPRVPDWLPLAQRIGLRKVGTWANFKAASPGKVTIARLDEIIALGMSATPTVTPLIRVEQGSDAYTPEVLAEGVAAIVRKGGEHISFLSLGNEPHGNEEQIAKNVAAYKVAYRAAKEANPDLFIVGTSVPADERYFDRGFHEVLDAYDYHVYGSYRAITRSLERYQQMAEQYGTVKPVFCTEMGVNSQGMARHAVSIEMIKNFTAFFAAGGAHASWFTIMYPDRHARHVGSSSEAHNMFDARHNLFNPKLDAITHYHYVNHYLDKTIVDRRVYDDGTHAYLFANDTGDCLQVLWNDDRDVTAAVLLPRVERVRVVRLDGAESTLFAHDDAVGLDLSAEPAMLRYQQTEPKLADRLAPPRLSMIDRVRPVVRGEPLALGIAAPANQLRVTAPRGWEASIAAVNDDTASLTLRAPTASEARAGRVRVHRLGPGATPMGELLLTVPLTGRVEATLTPIAASAPNGPGVRLVLTNRGDKPEPFIWALNLDAEHPMTNGTIDVRRQQDPTAYFAQAGDGDVTVGAGDSLQIDVPLGGVDAQTLYRVSAMVTDETGATVHTDRLMGGFAAAKRTSSAVTIDGNLNDSDWAHAPVTRLDATDQYFVFNIKGLRPEPWDGPADLSGDLRWLWDDEHLYLAVEVTDDQHASGKQAGRVWQQDGLQMLIDPARNRADKAGKYDYSLGISSEGPVAWRHLSASPTLPVGAASQITVATAPREAGGMTYEIAIPWTQLAPFTPAVGANLGVCLIFNEDDGEGRGGFMGFFSGAHTKKLDAVGDLVLTE